MSERALSEEAMLAGLRDIRLPGEAAGGVLAEVLAACALGLMLAVLVGLAARLVTRARPRLATPAGEMRHIDALPEAERQIALLHLLRARAPERYAALADGLYRPGGMPSEADLRAELVRHD